MDRKLIFISLVIVTLFFSCNALASSNSFNYYVDSVGTLNYDGVDTFYAQVTLINSVGQTIAGEIIINNFDNPQPYLFSLSVGEGSNKKTYTGFLQGNFMYTSPSGGFIGSPYHTFNIQGTFTAEELNSNNYIQGAMSVIIRANDKSGYFYSNFEEPESNIRFLKVVQSSTDIENLENRISAVESWKISLTNTINSILALINGLVITTDDHEDRIYSIESSSSGGGGGGGGSVNVTTINYFKYLTSADKKKLLCGYMFDKGKLANYLDLGMNCTATYRTSSTGKVSQSCKCV